MARRGCAGDTLARVTRLPRSFFTSAVLVISLATSVCFVSNNLNSRVQHRDVLALSVTLILRRLFGLPGARALNSIAENPLLPMLRDAIRHPFLSWAMLLVASVAPTLAIIGSRWRGLSETSHRMVMAAGFVGAVSLAVGAPTEIRIMTPAATMLVCSLVATSPGEAL